MIEKLVVGIAQWLPAPGSPGENLGTALAYIHDLAGTTTELAVYNAVAAAMHANMWNMVNGGGTINTVVVTKLDGVSAGVVFSTGGGAVWQGGGSGEPIPQGCAVVTFRTTQRGRSGRGRVYLPWITEPNQTAGVLSASAVTACQTAWDAFATALSTATYPLVVVSGVLGVANLTQSQLVRPFLKTQRRRALR